MPKLSKEAKQRLQHLFKGGQFAIRWGFIPVVLYLACFGDEGFNHYILEGAAEHIKQLKMCTFQILGRTFVKRCSIGQHSFLTSSNILTI
ncbi:hypothetical protein lerEdw1_020281 [Lerista edwardsae]|nr:hypothetical protein lerEdw1_020281 [Lerista edwardsae]